MARLSREEFKAATGVDDTWGIINWARDSDRAVWAACPRARGPMLESAAFRRWEALYQGTDAAHWLAFACWLTENIHVFLPEEPTP